MRPRTFIGRSGREYTFAEIGRRIREEHPKLVGAPALLQLNYLALREEFDGGTTPVALPYSFSEEVDG